MKSKVEKKNNDTINSSVVESKKYDYVDLLAIFLKYCEERKLSKQKVNDLVERLNNDLQSHLFPVTTRDRRLRECNKIVKHFVKQYKKECAEISQQLKAQKDKNKH